MKKWTKAELAYLAGIVDGEGSFSLAPTRKSSHIYVCRLSVGNTNPLIIAWLRRYFGGNVASEHRQNPKHKPVWRWTASGSELTRITEAVLPFLVGKVEQARIILAYRQTLAPAITGRRNVDCLTPEIKQARASFHAQLATLNRRGIDENSTGKIPVTH